MKWVVAIRMKIVDDYVRRVEDELEDAVMYAEKYILWKKKNPQFAKMYSEMALNEITHAGHVKEIGESEIMSLDWIPDDDKVKWQDLTIKIGKDTAWVKMLLNA